MEQRIRETAEQLFFTYGLKTVSMDDIAREAGVSKKTVYQFFNDKNTIVENVITGLVEQQQKQLQQSSKASKNAVHEMFLIAAGVQVLALKVRPVLLYDVNKYFPECGKLMKGFKEEDLRGALINNLNAGIKQGLYRKTLSVDVVAQFGLIQFASLFAPESYPNNEFNLKTVVCNITELFLYGIASAEGQIEIARHIDNKNNEHKS